jgi:hypothetical protein
MLQTAIDDKVRDMQFYRDEIQRLQELRNDILEDAAELRLKGEVAAQDAREFNQRAQNSALRSATSINATNERFNAKQQALAAYYGSSFYSTRGRGALALDPNNQALAQRTFQGMSTDPVRGFQALQADIDATQGVDKTAQGKGKTYDYMLSQYAGQLLDSGDPALAMETDPAKKQKLARTLVKQQLPKSIQDQIDAAEGARAAAAKTSGTVGGEAAAVGGVKVPFGTISPEEAQQPFELAATQMEERLAGLSAEEQQAKRSMELLAEQDPYFRAREQYRQTYFPGTQTPARVNEAMRQFLLLPEEERAPVIEAFRARRRAEDMAGRMPAETTREQLIEDFKEYLRSFPSDRQDPVNGVPYETKNEMMNAYVRALDAGDAQGIRDMFPRYAAGKEGPRMPGDVIYGEGSPFVGPSLTPEDVARTNQLASEVYGSMSERARRNIGLRAPEGLTEEQLSRLNAQGLDVAPVLRRDGEPLLDEEGKPVSRFVPFKFTEQIARDEEARLPTDMEAPPTLREREQDLSMEQNFPKNRQYLIGKAVDDVARTQEELDLALSNLNRAEYQKVDPKTIQVFRDTVDVKRAEDEAAKKALDEALGSQLEVDREVAQAERPPQMLGEVKPFSTMLDKAELRKMDEPVSTEEPVSVQDKDKRAKAKAVLEATKLVKEDKLNTSSPLGQAIDEFYQANKAGGFAMKLKDQISYIAKEFPDPKQANEAVTTLYGLYIKDENAKYLEPDTDLTAPPNVEEVPVQEGTLPTQEEAAE